MFTARVVTPSRSANCFGFRQSASKASVSCFEFMISRVRQKPARVNIVLYQKNMTNVTGRTENHFLRERHASAWNSRLLWRLSYIEFDGRRKEGQKMAQLRSTRVASSARSPDISCPKSSLRSQPARFPLPVPESGSEEMDNTGLNRCFRKDGTSGRRRRQAEYLRRRDSSVRSSPAARTWRLRFARSTVRGSPSFRRHEHPGRYERLCCGPDLRRGSSLWG